MTERKRRCPIWVPIAILTGMMAVVGAAIREKIRADGNQKQRAVPVIAYLPDYRWGSVDLSVYGRLTDLIFFSIEPKPTGELDLGRMKPEVLRQLRAIKEQHRVHVLVCLGGWGRSQGFGPMAADATARGHFVQTLTRLCLENQLDGVDFDWEHPGNATEEDAYASLLTETKQTFQPHHLLLTVALAPWQKLRADAAGAVDRVHLMAYDHDGRHATLADVRADVDRLVGSGVTRSKIYLGVPFYGRNITNWSQTTTYADIVRQYHPAPDVDEVGGIYFNGIRTIQQKARYVMETRLGGLMIWELGQDTNDDTSLLRAIDRAVSK